MRENKPEQTKHEEYVPSSTGAEILEVKRGVFFHYVEQGYITQLPGQGPRQGRYKLSDILELKQARANGTMPRKPYKKRLAPVEITWMQTTDVPAVLKLDYQVYHEMFLADAERYQSWREKNFRLSMAAFDKRDRNICLGYIGLLPLQEEVILDILRDNRDEKSIAAEEIETYDRQGGYTLLANSAAIHPDRPDLLRRILEEICNFWIGQYPERYIRKIYTQTVSHTGDRLAQKFFMSPRLDLAYNAFELDLSRPAASRIVEVFQKRMKSKAPLPLDLQSRYPEEDRRRN